MGSKNGKAVRPEKLAKKSFCKWPREAYTDEAALLKHLIGTPAYVCTKCGRAAAEPQNLCKPRDL